MASGGNKGLINNSLRKAVSYILRTGDGPGFSVQGSLIIPFVDQVLAVAFQIASKFGVLAILANELSRDD